MTLWKPMAALACGMSWLSPSLCTAAADELALTIYSSQQPGAISADFYRPVPGGAVPPASSVPGYALVRQNRDIELVAGQSTLRFTDVAGLIDPTTVTFTSLSDPAARVLEQNFQFDLVSTPKLLLRYLDREITVERSVGNEISTVTGTLLSAGDGLVLRSAEPAGNRRFASGGTGGETFHVTTLEDSGTNSFRDAVSQSHRTVVFDVGGIIRLKSNIAVSSDISILGQTAPGEGITLYGRSVSFSGQKNVVVRYLRFREGIAGDRGKCSVNISKGSDMIFDHCSIQWGRWDCLGLTQGSHDITFQNCIIGEGIDPQRFGSLSGVQRATTEEIAETSGIGKELARAIYDSLRAVPERKASA